MLYSLVLLVALRFTASAGFLFEDASLLDPKVAAVTVHEFNFVLTWEMSMLYTDKDDVQWVSINTSSCW